MTTFFRSEQRRPIIREREPEPMAAALARASSPTDAQRALQEVIDAMASDAARAGTAARAECEKLDETLKMIQAHVFRVVDDYAERVRAVTVMYQHQREQAVVAQRALYDAPLAPPVPPPGLLPDAQREIASDHEAP